MKLTVVAIHVTELEQSIRFYEDIIGLQVLQRFSAGPDQEIAYMGSDGAEVELIGHKELDSLSHDSHLSLGFQVDSLDETMKEIEEKGVKIESGPFEPNPQIRFCFIQDPNGVSIQIIERH